MSMPEADPLGFAQHEEGAKLDDGKNRLDLVLGDFVHALEEVGWIGTDGANKYTDKGWLSVPNGIERYGSAMLRHYFAVKRGEEIDKKSGSHHFSHMAWNALAILELTCRSSQLIRKPQVSISTQEYSPSLSQLVPKMEKSKVGDGELIHSQEEFPLLLKIYHRFDSMPIALAVLPIIILSLISVPWIVLVSIYRRFRSMIHYLRHM